MIITARSAPAAALLALTGVAAPAAEMQSPDLTRLDARGGKGTLLPSGHSAHNTPGVPTTATGTSTITIVTGTPPSNPPPVDPPPADETITFTHVFAICPYVLLSGQDCDKTEPNSWTFYSFYTKTKPLDAKAQDGCSFTKAQWHSTVERYVYDPDWLGHPNACPDHPNAPYILNSRVILNNRYEELTITIYKS